MSPFWFSCFDDLSPSALIWFSTFSDLLLLWLYIVFPNSKNSNWIHSLLSYINVSLNWVNLWSNCFLILVTSEETILRSSLGVSWVFINLRQLNLNLLKLLNSFVFSLFPMICGCDGWSPAGLRSNPVCCSLRRNTAYVNWILISVIGRKDGCRVRLQFPIGVEGG